MIDTDPQSVSNPKIVPKLLNILFVKFVLIGVFNTAFSYSIYAGLLFVGFNYALANLIALILGIIVSFRTQGRFVFGNTDIRLGVRFLLGWGFIYAVAVLLVGWMISLGINAYSAGAVALPFTAVTSFFVQKNFVFRVNRKRSETSHTGRNERLPT
jgi:putative flippase GtrA